MDWPMIPSTSAISFREPPSLDQSLDSPLIPYCFLQSPNYPLSLPRLQKQVFKKTSKNLFDDIIVPLAHVLHQSAGFGADLECSLCEHRTLGGRIAGYSGPPILRLRKFLSPLRGATSRRYNTVNPREKASDNSKRGEPSHMGSRRGHRRGQGDVGIVTSGSHCGGARGLRDHAHTQPHGTVADHGANALSILYTLWNSICLSNSYYDSLYIPEPLRASDNPPDYLSSEAVYGSFIAGGSGGTRGRKQKRDDDDEGQSGNSRDDGKGYGGGDDQDDDKDNEQPPKRKVQKKTAVACHFCRGRKLKCDGRRPTCKNCADRSLSCKYDETIRRRGPGRKKLAMMQMQQSAQYQQSQTSTNTILSLSTVARDTPIPRLPGPPIPAYNYPVGNIPGTSGVSRMRLRSPDIGSSSAIPQLPPYQQSHQYTQQGQNPHYTQRRQHELSYQQTQLREVALPPLRPPTYEQTYTYSSTQAHTTGNAPYLVPPAYHGARLEGSSREGNRSFSDDDDERTSNPILKRRTSSPPRPAIRRRSEHDDHD